MWFAAFVTSKHLRSSSSRGKVINHSVKVIININHHSSAYNILTCIIRSLLLSKFAIGFTY
jgi:hypothetical protein